MTETTPMPEQVFDALDVILDAFDVESRLDYFAKGDDPELEQGRQLLRAFRLVDRWCGGWIAGRAMTSEDICRSLKESDAEWDARIKQAKAA